MLKIGKETFMETIRHIPEQFSGRGEVKGYEFCLVRKTDRGFLYEVSSDGIKPHYEVFRFKINKQFSCVTYPGSKSFGVFAWTFKTKEMALKRLNEF
jgi:hypothetical protein